MGKKVRYLLVAASFVAFPRVNNPSVTSGLLVGQKKQFEDIIWALGNYDAQFFNI